MLRGDRCPRDPRTRIALHGQRLRIVFAVDSEPNRIETRERQWALRRHRGDAWVAVEDEAVRERGRRVVSQVPRGTIETDVRRQRARWSKPKAFHRWPSRFAHGTRGSAGHVPHDAAPRIERSEEHTSELQS